MYVRTYVVSGISEMHVVLNSRSTERLLLQTILDQLVSAIKKAVVSTEQKAPTIGSSVAIAELEPSSNTAQSVHETCSKAMTCLVDYMSSTNWQNLEQNLCSAISHLESYDRLVSSGDEWEELKVQAVLSSAKVCVGLAQTNLLCPSPVDPIVTSRTKHHCLELLVSYSNAIIHTLYVCTCM